MSRLGTLQKGVCGGGSQNKLLSSWNGTRRNSCYHPF